MATEFRALSRIEHGEEVEVGHDPASGAPVYENQVKVFEYGSTVEGLDKETMKKLWELGVLEQVEVPEPKIVYRDKSEEDKTTKKPAPAAPPGPPPGGGSSSPATSGAKE